MKRTILLLLCVWTVFSCEETLVKSDVLIPFRRGDKWGYCNPQKQLAISLKYDGASVFKGDIGVVGLIKGRNDEGRPVYKLGAIDKTGTEIIPIEYDSVTALDGGKVLAETKKRQWIFDMTGKEIAHFEYKTVYNFYEGLALVYNGRKFGFIDTEGREISAPQFAMANDFSDGLALVRMSAHGAGQYIDKTGNVKFTSPGTYEYSGTFHEGLAAVRLSGGKYGYIDKTGRIVIPGTFENAKDFSEGLAAVGEGNRYWYIDRAGKQVTPFYSYAYRGFRDGVAVMVKDGGDYLIDKTGRDIARLPYSEILEFHEGRAAVNKDGKQGFIDTTGKLVIPLKYEPKLDTAFESGYAVVYLGEKWGWIDKNGTEYWQ